MSEMAAGEAMAAVHNNRIKCSVTKEDGKEYFFAHYPDQEKPCREQQIIRISADDMAKWDTSMRRLTIRGSIAILGMFAAAIVAILLIEWSDLHLWLFYKLGIFLVTVVVLCLPLYWWMIRVDTKEASLRREIVKTYGSYDVERTSTVRRRLRGDSDAKPRSSDFLLMAHGETL